MASGSKIKTKFNLSRNYDTGFTLIESVVVLFVFVILIFIASQIYSNLMSSIVQAQNFQLALDNVRLGTEKIWNEIKLGSDFELISTSQINFLNRNCQSTKIYKERNNIFLQIGSIQSPIFDPKLVEVNKFTIYSDSPAGDSQYFHNTYKVFQIYYDVTLKSPRGNFPLKFWQTVAPLNSILMNPPCQ